MTSVPFYVLIIMLFAASDGGRTMNAELKFTSAAACEAAAQRVVNNTPKWVNWPPVAVCVEMK